MNIQLSLFVNGYPLSNGNRISICSNLRTRLVNFLLQLHDLFPLPSRYIACATVAVRVYGAAESSSTSKGLSNYFCDCHCSPVPVRPSGNAAQERGMAGRFAPRLTFDTKT